MEDLREFWRLIETAPPSIPHDPKDVDGKHMDLICRAGKEIATNPVLREVIDVLLTQHAVSFMLRPVVMTVTRMIDASVREHTEKFRA